MARVIFYYPRMRRMLTVNSVILLMPIGRRVEAFAKRYVREDTQELKNSIETRYAENFGKPSVQVGSDLERSVWVQQGTGVYGPYKQRIRPKNAKFLVFTAKDGTLVFAKSVRGMRSNKYLTRALRDGLVKTTRRV